MPTQAPAGNVAPVPGVPLQFVVGKGGVGRGDGPDESGFEGAEIVAAVGELGEEGGGGERGQREDDGGCAGGEKLFDFVEGKFAVAGAADLGERGVFVEEDGNATTAVESDGFGVGEQTPVRADSIVSERGRGLFGPLGEREVGVDHP